MIMFWPILISIATVVFAVTIGQFLVRRGP